MKFSSSIIFTTSAAVVGLTVVSAFSTPPTRSNYIISTRTTPPSSIEQIVSPLAAFNIRGAGAKTIDVINEFAQRDIEGMQNWALQNGVQKVDGVELASADGEDWQLITNRDIPAGNPILFVPAAMVLSSNAIAEEFGSRLIDTENAMIQVDHLTAQRIPLFRLMVKILIEYQKGEKSPYFPWLNSLPRRFYNGVAMTEDCFSCLPPYAAWLTSSERTNYLNFQGAIRKGYIYLKKDTIQNDKIIQWAYNVALTRFHEILKPSRQKLIAPMADMFNHATNPNVEITFDLEGNCIVKTIENVPAGSPLTISLGDPTNPTPIFAKYGFLYDDCNTIFCKAMHLKPEIDELGYDFKELLFEVDSGEIAPKVYDVFLYKILKDNDQNLSDKFYRACKMNDENLKQNFHQQYFGYTLEALQKHVGSILKDADKLTQRALSLDLAEPGVHPRVPIIVAHNDLVRKTFYRVQANLQNMG